MSLNPRFMLGDLDLTEWPFATLFGGDPGAPVNVAEVVDSMLMDGEVISSTRSSNRTMKYSVLIEEVDQEALAIAEAALVAEADKQRNQFSIDPGDGFGAVTVFDTFRAQVALVADEDREMAGFRLYDLTFQALPFGHSEAEITDDGLTAGGTPTTVVIADGTSATGWTSPYGSVTVSSGALLLPRSSSADSTWTDSYGNNHWQFRVEGSVAQAAVDYSATPYVQAEFVITNSVSQYPLNAPRAFADGVELPLLSTAYITNGLRCTYLCADSSVSALTFKGVTHLASISDVPPVGSVTIDNVQRSNQPPAVSSTGRESVRTVNVRGSARTAGRIAVSHETLALGDVVLHSCPALSSGYTPNLRQWRSSGGTVTADSTLVSGSREAISGGVVFAVPAAPMPRGAYLPYVRARAVTGAGTISRSLTMTVTTQVGSTQFGQQTVTSDTVSLTESTWTLVPLQDLTLPTTDVPELSAATIRVQLSASSGSVEYDEAWLFYAGEDSALTIVHAGSGSPSVGVRHNRLWLDSPTLDRPEHAVWLGTLADRSDAFFADIDSLVDGWGMHPLPAGDVWFFLVTTGPANALLSVAHKAAFHTHAYQVS